MKKLLLTVALLMSTVMFMNSAYAVWTCYAVNKQNPPNTFQASMSGPNAKAIAKTNALQACQNSPLTRFAGNCSIASCSYTYH